MLEGMYSAAAGMAAQQAQLDALSNDIANVSTTGYKPERMAFRDLLYSKGGIATQPGTQYGAGSAAISMGRDSTQGQLQQTGRQLDVAIQGQGYLQIKGLDGTTQLTRNGNLQIDVRGRISTNAGQLLSPTITLPKGADPSQLSISGSGAVAYAGKAVGQIKLVDVIAPNELSPVGDNAFVATAASGPVRAAQKTTSLTQGSLEASGVDLSDAMTSMIQTQRAYELASKVITTQDQVAQIANGVKA